MPTAPSAAAIIVVPTAPPPFFLAVTAPTATPLFLSSLGVLRCHCEHRRSSRPEDA
jgi:hypothetical protein